MLARKAKKIISKYSIYFKIGFFFAWILILLYFIKFREAPRSNHHGFVRSKFLFGYCLDVDDLGELSISECSTAKSPRWHLRRKMFSEGVSKKCVSYDLALVHCNQASKWTYDQHNKWIVSESTHQCLTLDLTSKTLQMWECRKDHDFNKWEFILNPIEIENNYKK